MCLCSFHGTHVCLCGVDAVCVCVTSSDRGPEAVREEHSPQRGRSGVWAALPHHRQTPGVRRHEHVSQQNE